MVRSQIAPANLVLDRFDRYSLIADHTPCAMGAWVIFWNTAHGCFFQFEAYLVFTTVPFILGLGSIMYSLGLDDGFLVSQACLCALSYGTGSQSLHRVKTPDMERHLLTASITSNYQESKTNLCGYPVCMN